LDLSPSKWDTSRGARAKRIAFTHRAPISSCVNSDSGETGSVCAFGGNDLASEGDPKVGLSVYWLVVVM